MIRSFTLDLLKDIILKTDICCRGNKLRALLLLWYISRTVRNTCKSYLITFWIEKLLNRYGVRGRPLIASAIAPYRFKFSQPWLTKRAITANHGHGRWAYHAIRYPTMSRFRGLTVRENRRASCSLRRFVHRCNAFPLYFVPWFPS